MFTHKEFKTTMYSVCSINGIDHFYEKPVRHISLGVYDPLYIQLMLDRSEKRDRYMDGVKRLEKRRRN